MSGSPAFSPEKYGCPGSPSGALDTGHLYSTQSSNLEGLTVRMKVLVMVFGAIASFAGADASSAGPLACDALSKNHYLAYGMKAPIPPPTAVNVVDLFGADVVQLRRPRFLFGPVNKNGSGLPDPAAHLSCYTIKGNDTPPSSVQVTNQLGTQQLRVLRKASLLCNPAEKGGVPLAQPIDHQMCYRVRPEGPNPPQASVMIEVDNATFTAVAARPTLLCNPVDKNGSGVLDPTCHLVCYKLRTRVHVRGADATIQDQFMSSLVHYQGGKTLCIPSSSQVVP
jgi:hypothetical protein